eukprot:8965621-Pyramimonas_sp.AAC.1
MSKKHFYPEDFPPSTDSWAPPPQPDASFSPPWDAKSACQAGGGRRNHENLESHPKIQNHARNGPDELPDEPPPDELPNECAQTL